MLRRAGHFFRKQRSVTNELDEFLFSCDVKVDTYDRLVAEFQNQATNQWK
jgi:hypothetical protein